MLKIREIFINKLIAALAQSSYLWKTLHLVWATAKGWTLAWTILLIFQGLLPVASVYLTRLLVDSLVTATKGSFSWASVESILVPAVATAVVLLLTQLIGGALNWIRTVQSELVQDHITALIHSKSIAADLAFFESSEFYDRLDRARSDAASRTLRLLENSGSLLQGSITLLAMATVLIAYGVWLPLALLISTLPAFYVVLKVNRYYHNWWQQTTSYRRWLYYYDSLLTLAPAAPEIKMFSLGKHFQSGYQALRLRLRNESLQIIKRQSLAQLGAGATALLVSGAVMAWMVWRVLQGFGTLGDLVLFYQAFNQGQSLMRSLLSNVGQIYTSSLFVSNLFEFLRLEPQVADPHEPLPVPQVLQHGIHFRQINFRYPGSEQLVLKDFNLTIPAGKVVAIVGDNGAGKSTLVKLLCRFYDPTSGNVEIDGTNIRSFSIEELRKLLTVLFQFPIQYHATAAQNIALGNLALTSPSAAEIKVAAASAGADEIINRLPQGYDTLLGKLFVEGTDLSGGQWQRIALARAFVRQAQIIILDEPTSAMDPWAEFDWLERFRTLANGRTALVITHRFTLAMRADIIHVMREGKIVESGSHEELLAQGGLYAQSWQTQMQASPRAAVQSSLP